MLRLLLAALAIGLAAPSTTLAEPNPSDCTGYPEQRVFLEAQSWWHEADGPIFGGAHQHVHVGACVPIYQRVDGVMRFDIVAKLHNLPGYYPLQTRVMGGGGDAPAFLSKTHEYVTCEWNDCTFVRTHWVDMSAHIEGLHEFKFHAQLGLRGKGTDVNFATNKWPMCVRTCEPDTTNYKLGAGSRGGGWYLKDDQLDLGYAFAHFDSREQFPWRDYTADGIDNPTLVPLRGWTSFPILANSFGGPFQNDGYEVRVDPDFHAGLGGIVLRKQTLTPPGDPQENVKLDTRLLSNGVHKLVIVSRIDGGFTGQLTGVYVVPFLVRN